MDQSQLVNDLAARAKRVGMSMAAVCHEAGVAPSTPSRWKTNKVGATLKTLRALEGVIERAEGSQDAS